MQWPGSNNRVRINWAMNIKIDQNKQLFEIFRIFFNIIKKIQYLLHKFCIWMQTKNLTLEEEKIASKLSVMVKLVCVWPTWTSPWYMKLRSSLRSSSLTSRRITIGCEQGLLCGRGNGFNSPHCAAKWPIFGG